MHATRMLWNVGKTFTGLLYTLGNYIIVLLSLIIQKERLIYKYLLRQNLVGLNF